MFVEVYAHAIWTFVVFWSDFVPQLEERFQLMMRDRHLCEPAVPKAPVREDVIAHAIWTVAVVFQSVVGGHHHHQVEDLVMVIAGASAHAIDPPLSFSLHQQVEEPILIEIQDHLADQADLVFQDKVHQVDQKVHEAMDEEEHQDHQRK